jgi:predicted ThiF/HesA family dinucleotide-utilizing enzyme
VTTAFLTHGADVSSVPENKSRANNDKIASDVNISHVRGGKTMIYDPTENILLSRNEETCGQTLAANILKSSIFVTT